MSRSRLLPLILAVLSAAAGLGLLCAWFLGLSPEAAARVWGMWPTTALSLFLVSAGVALLVSAPATNKVRRRVVVPSALSLFALVLVALDMTLGTQTSLEEALEALRGHDDTVGFPGLNSLISVSFLSVAGLALGFPKLRRTVSGYLALLAGILAFVAVLGHLYGAGAFVRVGRFAAVPLDAALSVLLLAAAILFLPPLSAVPSLVGRRSLAGSVARALLPTVIVLPPVATWFILTGFRAGYLTIELSFALAALVSVLALGLVVSLIVLRLERAEDRREEAEKQTRAANSRLQARARELAAANKELEAFSYAVSHDLRAPLRSIDGFSLALEEDETERLSDTGKSYLGRIRAASQKMGHLIDALLGLSRLSRAEMSVRPVDVSKLAAEKLSALRETEPGRKAEVRIEPDLTVLGDERLVGALLQNLLDNAWKFTEREPSTRIEVGGGTDGEGRRMFFVRDNGVGFDPQYQEKLFGAFQRLHSAKDFTGTGIGLATAQRIVRRHHGDIWAESQPGQGATFYFVLDYQPDEADDTIP